VARLVRSGTAEDGALLHGALAASEEDPALGVLLLRGMVSLRWPPAANTLREHVAPRDRLRGEAALGLVRLGLGNDHRLGGLAWTLRPPACERLEADALLLASLAVAQPSVAAECARLHVPLDDVPDGFLDALSFALARSATGEDRLLLEKAASHHRERARVGVARALALASRIESGSFPRIPRSLLDRLRVDPSPRVQAEAALASAAAGHESALQDLALALDLDPDVLAGPRSGPVVLLGEPERDGASLREELALAFDRIAFARGLLPLGLRPESGEGRLREAIREARARAKGGS
jgi:hypothetical protein